MAAATTKGITDILEESQIGKIEWLPDDQNEVKTSTNLCDYHEDYFGYFLGFKSDITLAAQVLENCSGEFVYHIQLWWHPLSHDLKKRNGSIVDAHGRMLYYFTNPVSVRAKKI